jgi:hypothetical protein
MQVKKFGRIGPSRQSARVGAWYVVVWSVFLVLLGSPGAGAVTWETPVRLSNDSAFSGYPDIAVQGSKAVVVWHDSRHVWPEIYAATSADGGTTWSVPQRVTTSKADTRFPQVAFGTSNVAHLVYQDNRADLVAQNYDIYYQRSPDGGVTWEPERALLTNPGRSIRPSIDADGNTVHVAWSDISGGMFDIYYLRSTDGGRTWASAVQLTSKPPSNDPDTNLPQQPPSLQPRVAALGAHVAITWYDCRHDREPLREPFPDNWEIYTIQSFDAGASWGPELRLTNLAGESTNPDTAWLAPYEQVVVWSDEHGNDKRDIFALSAASGVDEGPIDAAPGLSLNPRVVTRGNRLGVFWFDNRLDDAGWQIFFKESTDRGNTWPAAEQLTSNTTFAGNCAAASDGTHYFLVYQDNRHSPPDNDRLNNFEIFFMKGQ